MTISKSKVTWASRIASLGAGIMLLLLVMVSQAHAAGGTAIATDDAYTDNGGGANNSGGLILGYDGVVGNVPTSFGLIRMDVDSIYTAGTLTGAIASARLQIASPDCSIFLPGGPINVTLTGMQDAFDFDETNGATYDFATTTTAFNAGTTIAAGADIPADNAVADQVLQYTDAGGALTTYVEAQRTANGGDGIAVFAITPNGTDSSGSNITLGIEDYNAAMNGFGCSASPATFGPRLHIADAGGPLAVTMSDSSATTDAASPVVIWALFALLVAFSVAAIAMRRSSQGVEELS